MILFFLVVCCWCDSRLQWLWQNMTKPRRGLWGGSFSLQIFIFVVPGDMRVHFFFLRIAQNMGLTSGTWHFLCNFAYERLLWYVDVTLDSDGSKKKVALASGAEHFSRKFTHILDDVRCPRAFRLCEFGQNASLRFGLCGIVPENFRIEQRCDMFMCVSIPKMAQNLGQILEQRHV